LTAIRGSLQLLLAGGSVSDPDDSQLLTVALKSCERLVRIVNDMLDLSKIEAGRLQLTLERLDPPVVIAQAAEAVESLAREVDVIIQTDLAPDLPPIRGDADRLTQALVNLLSNAIKFAPDGSRVTISAREATGVVTMSGLTR
jgi:signal transduction histidine kinase